MTPRMHAATRRGRLAITAAMAMLSATAVQAKPLTVIELFTSQGCSSCPPANANLVTISSRPDVLALSFGVTYWDYLGWKDSFAKDEFTERQRIYEPPLGRSGPFTPQVVVNGSHDTVGNRLGDIERLIGQAQLAGGPAIDLVGTTVHLGAGKAAGSADVWVVRYHPGTIEVPVARGENTGRTLPHANVVRALSRIGQWDGKAQSLNLPKAGDGLKTAILIQAPDGGPILAAATD